MPVMTRARARATLGRFAKKVGKFRYRRQRIYRNVTRGNPRPVFTETCDLSRFNIILGGGGSVVGQLSITPVTDVNQWANYAELYNQYRVLNCTYYLFPAWTAYDPEWGVGSVIQPRFTYAIQDSPGAPVPGSEIDVLNNNGCRVVPVTKMIKIRTRPMPQFQDTAIGGATTNFSSTRRYVSTIAAQSISWGVVNYACRTPTPLPVAMLGTVYTVVAKIRLQFRDPK